LCINKYLYPVRQVAPQSKQPSSALQHAPDRTSMSARRSSAGSDDRDQARLQQLGYKQELKRGLSYVPHACMPLISKPTSSQ
jgi:hypothetical protein